MYTLHWGVNYNVCLPYQGSNVKSNTHILYYVILISEQCSSTAHVIIKVLWILNDSKEFYLMKLNINKYIYKKIFPPETHTCVKELIISEGVHFLALFFIFIIVIIVIIGLIKYLVWFMLSKLSIHVSKQNDKDHLASQSPLFIVQTNSNFRMRFPL